MVGGGLSPLPFPAYAALVGGRQLWRQLRGGDSSSGVGRSGFASGPSHPLAE